MDYNRVVKDLNGLSEAEFLAKVSEKFETRKLTQQAKPEEKGQMTMYLHGSWYPVSYTHLVRKSLQMAETSCCYPDNHTGWQLSLHCAASLLPGHPYFSAI